MKRSIHFSRVLPATLALTAFSCAVSLTLLSAGCGGGGNKTTTESAATRKTGSVTMTVKWPRAEGTRKIPLAAQSITLLITGEGGTQTQTVARPANGSPSPVTFANLPIRGEYLLTGTALASTDGTGVALARASVPIRFTLTDNVKAATLDLATTIVRLAVSPNPLSLSTDGANSVVTLSAAGFDAPTGGNLVPVSDVNFTIANAGVASLTEDPATGIWTITGRAEGQTTLTATDSETGITTTVPVEVGRIASPVWSETLDGPIRTGAAISPSGNVLVGGALGRLYGFTPAGAPINGNYPVDLSPAPLPLAVSQPTFAADGTVYAFDEGGNIAAFNEAAGTSNFLGVSSGYVFAVGIRDSRIISRPVVAPDGAIYAGTIGGAISKSTVAGGTLTNELFSVATGAVKVNTPTVDPATGNIFATSSTLTGQSAQFHGIRPDGTRVFPAVDLDGALAAGTALGTGGRVIAVTGLTAGENVKVYGINTADGTIAWQRILPNTTLVSGAPVVGGDGTVYVGTWGGLAGTGVVGGQVFALDGNTGDIKPGWPFRIPFDPNTSLYSDIDSSVAVGPDGNVYAGSVNGKLYGIRPSGAKLWEASLFSEIHSTPAVGADGTVYVGADNFTFTAFR